MRVARRRIGSLLINGLMKLGRTLFFDKRLSSDGTVSCAICNDPAFAFTDANPLATGTGSKTGSVFTCVTIAYGSTMRRPAK